jgi:CubicO group peptidase (beta-lactamase class C family)
MSATRRTWESLNYRILSTAGDLAVWTDALYNRKLILPDKMLDKMLTFHSPTPNDFPLSGYGYGVCSFEKKETKQLFGYEIDMIGHVGNGADYKSIAVYLPEYSTTISLLINEDETVGLISIFSEILAVVIEYKNKFK